MTERKKRVGIQAGVEKLNQQMKDEVIDFILQGYSMTEITDYLQLNYNLKIENARRYYKEANLSILELGEFDIENIIMQHVFYYEEASRFFDSIGDFNSKGIALNAKEKLLKIFEDDSPTVEVENNININVVQLNYDIEKLTEQEKNNFSKIFDKVTFVKS